MADSPQNQPVDPDAPTEKVVKQALSQLPTWEEWLRQNDFKLGKEDKYAWSDVEWNRHWPNQGRGWQIRVYPEKNIITADVYNNVLRWGRSLLKFFVNERTLPKVLGEVIKEIERNVSDQTRKRRLKMLHAKTPEETRVNPDDRPVNGPVMTPDNIQQLRNLGLMQQEAVGPIRQPIPDDPNDLNPEQMGRMLDRLQARCFQKGQRVRIRTPRHTRLNGEMGTVVDAGPHSCYVAVDSYVEAGDPDPFRFEEHELEPVFESAENVDDPEPYMAALDYISPLKEMGYQLLNGVYRKSILLGNQIAGYLKIIVRPSSTSVGVFTDYQAVGETERIQDIPNVDVLDVLDLVREIEQIAIDSDTISEFARKLKERNLPGSVPYATEDRLYYLFGESMMEPDDVDNPMPYFQELQRHADVINEFRERGVRMRRRMTADRPYYSMFWIPNAVTDVSYDIYLQPDGEGWAVSAEGNKRFDHERWGQFDEEFSIDHTWSLPGDITSEDLRIEVDNILDALSAYTGPEEPTVPERDYDDIDENVDDIGDYEKYAKDSANYNIVSLITSKDLRKIVRELGFKVNTLYRSRITQGWSMSATPATAQAFEVFQTNPYKMAEFLNHELRQGLIKRFPELGKITQGQYVFDQKLDLHCWEWSGATSADPSNPNNWVLYADVRPIDWAKRGRGGKMLEGVDDPDEVLDVTKYAKESGDAVKAIEQAGYTYGFDRLGRERWNKYWPLPKPLRHEKPWSPIWTKFWGSPDPWGQFVYGLQSDDFVNATAGGYIVVRPVQAPANPEGWDYSSSVRRVLLKVEQMVRSLPDTTDIDVMRNHIFHEMERIKNEVNAEADSTILPESASVPEPDPDEVADPMSYATDTLTLDAFMRENRYWQDADKRYWYKNIDDDTQFVIWLKPDVSEVSLQLYRQNTLPNSGMKHWQLQAALDGISFGKLKHSLLTWEERVHRADDAFWKQPGALARITEGIDDPEEVLAGHKPRAYALYGQYANYDAPVSFSTFKTLPEAVARAKERNLHNEYDYVWADELEFDSLDKWDTGETMACKYTGIKYRITPEYEVERVEHPDAVSGAPPVPPVAESEDEDVDTLAYVKTTFDPVEFLRSQGWQKLKQEHYEYWYKDWPLPRPYHMGGMTFTKLRVIIGFDLKLRGAFSAHVNVYWSDESGHGFPVKGWSLDPQPVYPQLPGAEDISDKDLDFDMPLRRFARGIEAVLNNIAWPENSAAVLHANTRLEAEFGRFVRELNQQAETPIYPQRPVEEASDDPDDPETVLQSQPGFEFRKTQHMGDMVFVKGPGEDKSDWPRDIGRIVLGPPPDPNVNPEQRWYVIGVRGVPPENLGELGFGIGKTPKLRTFDSPDEAALAIWLVWSRQNKKQREGYLLQ